MLDFIGFKTETEAEGSSRDDIWRMKVLATKYNKPLFVKIGGCEAVTDIFMCYQIEVDGIIAPMIESDFAAYKFFSAVRKIYGDKLVKTVLNLESKTAIENLDKILAIGAKYGVTSINVGQTDLSTSYFDANIVPNSDFTMNVIKQVAQKCQKLNIKVSLGGSIDLKTLTIIKNDKLLLQNLFQIETRNIIFNTNSDVKMLDKIKDFEIKIIQNRLDITRFDVEKNENRLKILNDRL